MLSADSSGPAIPDSGGGSKRLPTRLIARLDIKGPNLVKGVQLEGLRVVGDPAEHALRYYRQGADELLYVDIVASLYGRNSLLDVVERTASEVFVPLVVAGGIRSPDDIFRLLRAGADKVAINTAAVRRPELISEAARAFGSQCIVASIEAKRRKGGGWEAFTDNGREHTGLDAVDWARRATDLGAGELLLTSVDREGKGRGMDLELVRAIAPRVGVPVIVSGGAGSAEHVAEAVLSGADAVAVARLLHYGAQTVSSLKAALMERDIEVRT